MRNDNPRAADLLIEANQVNDFVSISRKAKRKRFMQVLVSKASRPFRSEESKNDKKTESKNKVRRKQKGILKHRFNSYGVSYQ